MRSLILLLALLIVVGQAKAQSLPGQEINPEEYPEAEVLFTALQEATDEQQAQYANCMETEEKEETNCENEYLGDIHN